MIQTIYLEVPFDRLSYLERPEFSNGTEQGFHDTLKASMEKHGMRDPVYCWYNSKAYGSKIKIIVGNNRMVVAKELGLDPIRTIITNWKADEFPLEGKEFKDDEEIKSLFHLPDQIHVRRDKNGDIDQVTPPHFPTVKEHYV
jgi:hypothetical protein